MSETTVPDWLQPGRRIAVIQWSWGTRCAVTTSTVGRVTDSLVIDEDGGQHTLANLVAAFETISTPIGPKGQHTGRTVVAPFGSSNHLAAISYSRGEAQPALVALHEWEQDRANHKLAAAAAATLIKTAEMLKDVTARQRAVLAEMEEAR